MANDLISKNRPASGYAFWRPMSELKAGLVGLAIGLIIIGGALIGPLLATVSPTDFVGAPFDPPSQDAMLGTDFMGRDVLSRVLHGGTQILGLSALATVIGVLCGTLLGIVGGYLKGRTDDIIMRLLDVAMAFPQTVLALLFISIVGPKSWLIAILVAAIHIPQVARVMRSVALRVSEEDYIRYAEAIGVSMTRIITREILPNLTAPLMVELGLRFTYSIALIAGLGFLGLMADPSVPDWGMMVNENRIGLLSNAWAVAAPVLILAVLTIGTNIFADSLGRTNRGMPSGPTDDPKDDEKLSAGKTLETNSDNAAGEIRG
ncbi:ABC transporter permease [Rhizobium leguminosarum]|uniref:ABC transporter permease subunit n=1 Tax=Rhizobium leguminosarum TaxID=384 RepID=A0A6P0B2T7_RHILE|nr:ABC transporter permease [Rhizobium leguminosarum]MBY5435871.1 ABC transporter permease [Rhizobium leguminosarum]NEI34203.1 ABC transporter permease subunit [Rhizobium leguminosarum]NEI40566.1 ABC transporter permease subunit [Rhizobium leguminosarum]